MRYFGSVAIRRRDLQGHRLTVVRCFQKIEAPVRKREGVEEYKDRKSEVDDVLTSPELNRDTELFGTEVGRRLLTVVLQLR